jgi:hypothetical protein
MIDDNGVDNDRDIQPGAAAHTVAGTDVADKIKPHNCADVVVGDELLTPVDDATAASWKPVLTNGYRRLIGLPCGVVVKPLGAVGGFFAMALDTLVLVAGRPFTWREFLLQS